MEIEVKQSAIFAQWLDKLKDKVAKASIVRRIVRLRKGNFGDSKSIGDSVFELRVDVGKGYRVYFMNENGKIILLLVGGDKSTQQRDIEKAKEMAKEIKQ